MLSSRVQQSSAPPSIKSQVDLDRCSRACAWKSVKHTKGISGPLKEKPKPTKQNSMRVLQIVEAGEGVGVDYSTKLFGFNMNPCVIFISKEGLPEMLIPSLRAGSQILGWWWVKWSSAIKTLTCYNCWKVLVGLDHLIRSYVTWGGWKPDGSEWEVG